MNKRKVLIFQGGWAGHTPAECAKLVADKLRGLEFDVETASSLSCLDDAGALSKFDLIVPIWTGGKLAPEQAKNLVGAVKGGVGIAGFHGGMGDAFNGVFAYEWMVGGKFVGHPHVGKYTVRILQRLSPITDGLPDEFEYDSEQYYMLTDPGNNVLAETDYMWEGSIVKMPVVWTKKWGEGRVFYSALGHTAAEMEKNPETLKMVLNGMIWASRK